MEPLSKRVSDQMEDRISGLPSNLHDHILSSMSIFDAARTSILSRTWRYIWASNPRIVFDKRFFEDMAFNSKATVFFPRIVSYVLLMHNGPILEFSLRIPCLPLDLSSDFDQWLLFLSKNGIKRLEIKNLHPKPFKLPSSIFMCNTLRYLKVNNITLEPPHGFKGFQNLEELYLINLSFAPIVSSSLLVNALKLQELSISLSSGIEHLRIHAPKLYKFHLWLCCDVDWQWFESNQQLEDVEIILSKEVKSTYQGNSMNLGKLFGILPRLGVLWLDGFSLKFLAADHVSPRLPSPAQNIFRLGLHTFAVSDLDQILCSLCLLRSLPNLEEFYIVVDDLEENMVEPVIRCLEASKCNAMKENLTNLECVVMKTLRGSMVELLLVKLLLECSTSLEMMLIELSTDIDVEERDKISTEVSNFSQASTNAKVIIRYPDLS